MVRAFPGIDSQQVRKFLITFHHQFIEKKNNKKDIQINLNKVDTRSHYGDKRSRRLDDPWKLNGDAHNLDKFGFERGKIFGWVGSFLNWLKYFRCWCGAFCLQHCWCFCLSFLLFCLFGFFSFFFFNESRFSLLKKKKKTVRQTRRRVYHPKWKFVLKLDPLAHLYTVLHYCF